MNSAPPMRSVTEHQRLVAGLIRTPAPVPVPLALAAGRVLAEDIVARIALPGFDNSAMDGYAVRAADVAAASSDQPVSLPVLFDIPAGCAQIPPLQPDAVHRIMTGAPIPDGADAVVPVEATDGRADVVAIRQPAVAGRHIRRSGEDVAIGDTVLRAGAVLGAARIGLLAALGVAEVTITPALRVLVLSTGTELVEPGRDLEPGQIYESNGPMLAAAIDAAGAAAKLLRFVPDDVAQFRATLDTQLGDVDLIVTSGGVSAGAYEVVKDALASDDVEFAKVAMQPGMPQGAGHYQGIPIVTFPGNPVSSLISFEVFLRPALRAAMRLPNADRPKVHARLAEPLDAPAGKRQFRRGSLDIANATVSLVGKPASHYLRSLAASDCLLDIATDITHLDAGAEVEVWRIED